MSEPIKAQETQTIDIHCPNCDMIKQVLQPKDSITPIYNKCMFCDTLMRYSPSTKDCNIIIPATNQHHLYLYINV